MKICFFNNDTILAPLKCGTRYLMECFGEESSTTDTTILKYSIYHKNVNTIVVRSPFEHLESAIHTELLPIFSKGIDNDKMETEILNILERFKSTPHLSYGTTHWSYHIYEQMYWYWRRNRKYIKVIKLSELSDYLKGIKTELPKYDPDNYTFNNYSYWCSKEDLMRFVKENYKSIWNDLVEQIKISNKWYELLITETPIEIRLI
jgi:hypothetical protein